MFPITRTVLVFFIAGLLFLAPRARRTLGAYRIPRETGLLISSERWQRVRIEFEFESRNFRDHGHPASGCDVIVCWRHNWDECPENIEVVELSRVIKSLANSED